MKFLYIPLTLSILLASSATYSMNPNGLGNLTPEQLRDFISSLPEEARERIRDLVGVGNQNPAAPAPAQPAVQAGQARR
jgi:hypothetical protein